jgi:hypothetical protein
MHPQVAFYSQSERHNLLLRASKAPWQPTICHHTFFCSSQDLENNSTYNKQVYSSHEVSKAIPKSLMRLHLSINAISTLSWAEVATHLGPTMQPSCLEFLVLLKLGAAPLAPQPGPLPSEV